MTAEIFSKTRYLFLIDFLKVIIFHQIHIFSRSTAHKWKLVRILIEFQDSTFAYDHFEHGRAWFSQITSIFDFYFFNMFLSILFSNNERLRQKSLQMRTTKDAGYIQAQQTEHCSSAFDLRRYRSLHTNITQDFFWDISNARRDLWISLKVATSMNMLSSCF